MSGAENGGPGESVYDTMTQNMRGEAEGGGEAVQGRGVLDMEEGTPDPWVVASFCPQGALGSKLWFSAHVLSSSISTGSDLGHILH